MAAMLAAASYSRIGFSLYLALRARRVRVPGGSRFHLEPGTIHPYWNLTGNWCLWSYSNFLKIALFSICDRGGGDVWYYNPPSLNSRLPSNIEIDPELLYIWASGGGCPLSWVFWDQWYYWLRLQRRICLSGWGILAWEISFPPVFVSSPPFIELWWKLRQVLLRKQRTWKI